MASKLCLDGTFIEVKDMSEEQVYSVIDEIQLIATWDDVMSEILDGIHTTDARERLSAILDFGDIYLDLFSSM